MSDQGEIWRAIREAQREERARLGVECPGCRVKRPKANPTILLPQQQCRVCGYRDPRARQE
jgi:hypothetical protein